MARKITLQPKEADAGRMGSAHGGAISTDARLQLLERDGQPSQAHVHKTHAASPAANDLAPQTSQVELIACRLIASAAMAATRSRRSLHSGSGMPLSSSGNKPDFGRGTAAPNTSAGLSSRPDSEWDQHCSIHNPCKAVIICSRLLHLEVRGS